MMSNLEALDDRVRELANLRKQLQEVKYQEELRENIYMSSGAYADFLDAHTERIKVEQRVRDAETWVRSMAVSTYNDTKEKKFPGVSIGVGTKMTYDAALALEWCKERLPEALAIIPKTFEKVAEIMKPDFVKFTDEPSARIAKDLSEFLDMEDVESYPADHVEPYGHGGPSTE